jgi:HSP20 family protein
MAEKQRSEQETRQPARAQQAGVARRHYYDPFLLPFGGELFSPFSMMRRMMDEFDRTWSGLTSRSAGAAMWAPAIEVSQEKDKFTVCAELPGLTSDDVHVEATEDELIIEGERKQETTGEEGGVRRTERHYGRFYRTIPLPEGANADQAKARFNNGVLEVTIPLQEERSSRRRIPLEAGESGAARTSGGEQTKK